MIVYGFPTKLQALQFEWAWQNPHASRHLHASPAATPPSTDPDAPVVKPTAQFPKSTLSNRPLTKVQVLMFMLTVAPWKAFNLKVLLFSDDAQSWWNEARVLGPVMRTDAGVRKWEFELRKRGKKRGEVEQWTVEQAARIDSTEVVLRREGVDGERLVRHGQGDSVLDKIDAHDGERSRCVSSSLSPL